MRRYLNRSLMSVVGLSTVLVVGTAYLLGVVLDVPLTRRPDSVTVQLPRTGGLFDGSPVSYRGVRVGTVTHVGLADGRAVATVSLREDTRVPRTARATVRSLSPVGEQFLDFQPDAAKGPYLADGDVVKATADDLPVSLAQAADGLDNVLSHVDEKDLRVVLDELTLATGGIDGELDSLLDSTEKLTTTLDEAWPQTARLLRNGRITGEVLASHRDKLAQFSGSAKLFTDWLADFDPEFRRILATAPADLDTMALLAEDLEEVLPGTLAALGRLTGLLADRDPHVRELTTSLDYGASRFSSAFNDGWLDVDLLLQGERQCSYGTPRRDPTSTDRQPLNTEGHCRPGGGHWRGAQHTPPPLNR